MLAAEAVSYLLRQAPAPALRVAVKAALAEAVSRPSLERIHAAGALLAEAARGTSHGLHSRAGAVLGLLLQPDILTPGDFKSAKVGCGPGREGGGGLGGVVRALDASSGSGSGRALLQGTRGKAARERRCPTCLHSTAEPSVFPLAERHGRAAEPGGCGGARGGSRLGVPGAAG
jgi:hypothetical protein